MRDSWLIAIVVVVTALFIGGGVLVAKKAGSRGVVETTNAARLAVTSTDFDWGKIPIDGGKAEAVFELKNEGTETLQLFSVSTSCACTTAQLMAGEKQSPVIGMHSRSNYVAEVPPGETAQLKVVFDPAFHGPQGVGVINRQVTVRTNDQARPEVMFNLKGEVFKP